MKRGSHAEVDINELNMSVVRMREEMDLVKEFSLQVSEGMQASTKLLVALQEMLCVVEKRLLHIEQKLGMEEAESMEQAAERALEE